MAKKDELNFETDNKMASSEKLKALQATMENIKLQIGYTSAAKEYEKAVYDYSNITVYAPFDGVIADLEVKEYNQSSAYKEVCSVIDDATMEIVFNVLETEIAHLKAGMEVEITPYANDKVTLKGTVTEVNPKIDENGMVKVRATTDNPEAVLVDGRLRTDNILPEKN